MEYVIRHFIDFGNSIAEEINRFDETTCCVLSVATVLLGYYLLRGQPR